MSIYSGSFGHHKASYTVSQDEVKNVDDNLNEPHENGTLEMKDPEDLIVENDKIRWVPNDAYDQ